MAAGLPDIFGGAGAAAGEPPAVDRIEVAGADPAGLKLLATRQVLRDAWIGFQAMWSPRLEDSEELVARGDRWNRLGHWRLAEADYRAALHGGRELLRATALRGCWRKNRAAATPRRRSGGRDSPRTNHDPRATSTARRSGWRCIAPAGSPRPPPWPNPTSAWVGRASTGWSWR